MLYVDSQGSVRHKRNRQQMDRVCVLQVQVVGRG